MNQAFMASLGGLVAGAGLMYLADPGWGRRRRSLVRDKAVRGLHELEASAVRTSLDLAHRTRGAAARLRQRLDREPPDDGILDERVRARLGRLCSHPHAIEVLCENGQVQLTGPILARELDRLLAGVAKVRGVTQVENQLEVYERADSVPDLQGGRPLWEGRRNWTPTTGLLVGLAGAGLVLWGVRRRGPGGGLAAALGGGALLRGLSSHNAHELIDLATGGREAVEKQELLGDAISRSS